MSLYGRWPLFAKVSACPGCRQCFIWTALCRGPYGEELLHQMWVLYDPMNWPIETQLFFSYTQFVRIQQRPGYWLSDDGQTELQRLLTSQITSEIVHGLFACAVGALDNSANMFDVNLVLLDQVEILLFDEAPAIRAAAVYIFALITAYRKQTMPASSILDHLLILWLDNDNHILEKPLCLTFSALIGLPRHSWEPKLSESQVLRVHQLAELKLEQNVSIFSSSACLMIAFHAKNVWHEDELASRLIAINNNQLPIEHSIIKIDDMLKQMGEVGMKYLTQRRERERERERIEEINLILAHKVSSRR